MSVCIRTVTVALTAALTAPSWAGIPEPDVRLHGRVRLDGQPVVAGNQIALVAQHADSGNEVGRFDFGAIDLNDCNQNGLPDAREIAEGASDVDQDGILDECNHYVLRMKMEASVLDEPDNAHAARVGNTVNIYALNDQQKTCVTGPNDAAACQTDADCAGPTPEESGMCTPAKTLMAVTVITETGQIRELNLGTCRDGTVSNLAVITSRLHVDTLPAGAADGSNWSNAMGGLGAALAARECAGSFVNEIWLKGGTYTPTQRSDPADPRSASFVIPDGVSVTGGFDGTESSSRHRAPATPPTVLSGDIGVSDFADDNAYHVVTCRDTLGASRLDGLTITRGQATGIAENGHGGGILLRNARTTVANCTLTDNHAVSGGGGVHITGGAPTISDTVLTENAASEGNGGAIFSDSPRLRVIGCTFAANSAPGTGTGHRGGAVFLSNTGGQTCAGGPSDGEGCFEDGDCLGGVCQSVDILRSTFGGNSADLGGAVANVNSSPQVVGCSFHGNGARNGGAIHNDNHSRPLLVNGVFTGNVAITGGGAIYNQSATTLMMTNCTLAGNDVSAGTGGGIGSFAGSGNNNTVTIANSILWGNTAAGATALEPQQVDRPGITLQLNSSCVQGLTGGGGGGNIDVDPFFVRTPHHGGDRWGDNPRTPSVDEGANDDFGDVHLTVASACNDAGNSDVDIDPFFNDGVQALPPNDHDGGARRLDNVCATDLGAGAAPFVDMGAYEFATPLPRDVMFVRDDAAEGGDGSSWTSALRGLELATCVAAGSGGTTREVWVAGGTYRPTLRTQSGDPRSARFLLADGVTLYGGFAGTEEALDERHAETNPTILSGDLKGDDQPGYGNRSDNAYHVVVGTGASPDAVLDGFTLYGGQADAAFGTNGIGGGLWIAGGSPTVRSCTLTGNVATRGAGLYASDGAAPRLERCVLQGNTALGDGGGIYNLTAAPTLIDCVIEGNRAGTTAGGLRSQDGSSTTLVNCLLWGNEKDAVLDRASSHTELINCTIVGHEGYGVRSLESSLPTVTNSVIWLNGAGAVSGGATIGHSCVQGGFAGAGVVSEDPLFVEPSSGDYRLSLGSPCIGVGDNTALPLDVEVDLDGHSRIVQEIVDAGAYENQAAGGADSNGDGVIDDADYAVLAQCLFGPDDLPSPPGGATAAMCLNVFDTSADRDVDLEDVRTFQRRFGTAAR